MKAAGHVGVNRWKSPAVPNAIKWGRRGVCIQGWNFRGILLAGPSVSASERKSCEDKSQFNPLFFSHVYCLPAAVITYR